MAVKNYKSGTFAEKMQKTKCLPSPPQEKPRYVQSISYFSKKCKLFCNQRFQQLIIISFLWILAMHQNQRASFSFNPYTNLLRRL